MENEHQQVSSTGFVKRYHTQRNMNRPIFFYGLTGLQAVLMFGLVLVFYLTIGNFGPCLVLLAVPFLQKNKRKISEGDPNYMDTVIVGMSTKRHYQDSGSVLRVIANKWLKV